MQPEELNSNIPNAVSPEKLKEALEKVANPIEIDGKTPETVLSELMAAQLKLLGGYENDRIVVDKMLAILSISRIIGMAELMLDKTEDKEQKKANEAHIKILTDVVARIRAVPVSDNDIMYESYNTEEVSMLSKMSEDSREIVAHFGIETPALLNKYSIALEDALIEQVQKNMETLVKLSKYEPEQVEEIENLKKRTKDLKTMRAEIFED